mmetsp:Transcript_3587/g.4940  ORF Transcript_3587/g.4940 Transcript_3587/m.4940 type:complete len:277 (+) Transcript_3587:616-1446(+)
MAQPLRTTWTLCLVKLSPSSAKQTHLFSEPLSRHGLSLSLVKDPLMLEVLTENPCLSSVLSCNQKHSACFKSLLTDSIMSDSTEKCGFQLPPPNPMFKSQCTNFWAKCLDSLCAPTSLLTWTWLLWCTSLLLANHSTSTTSKLLILCAFNPWKLSEASTSKESQKTCSKMCSWKYSPSTDLMAKSSNSCQAAKTSQSPSKTDSSGLSWSKRPESMNSSFKWKLSREDWPLSSQFLCWACSHGRNSRSQSKANQLWTLPSSERRQSTEQATLKHQNQ